MSKLQHSPGPWTYLTFEEGIENAEGRLIADMRYSPHHGDGRLIAAAPDMLRLLRVLVEMSESGAEDREGWTVWNAASDEAAELIARLDGGE